MKLSILIPTTPDRRDDVNLLISVLYDQIIKEITPSVMSFYPAFPTYGCKLKGLEFGSDIEIVTALDNKEISVGLKRRLLYSVARGEYSWQIDSDDGVSGDAISEIWKVLGKADCVTFREKCLMNGNYFTSNHSIQYNDWQDNFGGFDYVRTPFFKDVIKTELCNRVPVADSRYGEDIDFARRIKPLLLTEFHIDKEIYYYIHNSKPEDHNERYGIKTM